MRTVIAITTLAFSAAGAVNAYAAEDRYGPPPTRALVAVAGVAGQAQTAQAMAAPSAYNGRLLGWSGKTAPRALVAPLPAPAAPSYAPTPIVARAAPLAPSAPRYQPQAPLPQSLYDRPAASAAAPLPAPSHAPAPIAQQAPAFQPRYQPLPTRDQPRAARTGYEPSPPPAPVPAAAPQPRQIVAAASPAPNRAYSVLREFGAGQPDPIALPPPQSYWATREDARRLADPTYGEGLSKKSGDAVPREDAIDGGVAPRPSEPKP